jgi:hypothetical protein
MIEHSNEAYMRKTQSTGGLNLIGVEESSQHRADETGIYPVVRYKAKANSNNLPQSRL